MEKHQIALEQRNGTNFFDFLFTLGVLRSFEVAQQGGANAQVPLSAAVALSWQEREERATVVPVFHLSLNDGHNFESEDALKRAFAETVDVGISRIYGESPDDDIRGFILELSDAVMPSSNKKTEKKNKKELAELAKQSFARFIEDAIETYVTQNDDRALMWSVSLSADSAITEEIEVSDLVLLRGQGHRRWLHEALKLYDAFLNSSIPFENRENPTGQDAVKSPMEKLLYDPWSYRPGLGTGLDPNTRHLGAKKNALFAEGQCIPGAEAFAVVGLHYFPTFPMRKGLKVPGVIDRTVYWALWFTPLTTPAIRDLLMLLCDRERLRDEIERSNARSLLVYSAPIAGDSYYKHIAGSVRVA